MGTNTLTKPFDKKLYDQTDGKAKRKIKKYLRSKDHIIDSNTKEDYKCDVKSISGRGILTFSEVEIKLSWKGEWPTSWKDVRIPYRKKKLLDSIESDLTFYIFREDCKEMWVIPDHIIKEKGSVVEVSNRFVREGEQFYSIPVECIYKVKLTV